MNELEQLHNMEAMAVEAAAKIISGSDELAIAVHEIYSKKLYLAERDGNNNPIYLNQQDYEPVLLQKLGIARSTLYNHYTPIKIACGPSFRLTYEEFVETGGKRMWTGIEQAVNYNRITGEVESLKNKIDLPPGVGVGEYIIEQVRELAPSTDKPELNLTPTELRKEIVSRFGNEPNITFSWWSDGVDVKTKYTIEYSDGESRVGFVHDFPINMDVLSEYKRRLKIS